MYASYTHITFCLNSLLVAPKCTTKQRRQRTIRMFVRLFVPNEKFSFDFAENKFQTNEQTHTKFGNFTSTNTLEILEYTH